MEIFSRFYDGEGTIGMRVAQEKRRKRKKGDTEGWYILPYIQIANTERDDLKNTKFRRKVVHKYNLAYFKRIWG